MSDPVLPYEPPKPRHLGRQIFGVIVRTVGLVVGIYGIYSVIFAAVSFEVSLSVPYANRTYALFGIIYLALGIALIRGEWVVTFAYGRE